MHRRHCRPTGTSELHSLPFFFNLSRVSWVEHGSLRTKHADSRVHAAEQSIYERRQKWPTLLCRYIEDYERFKESRSNPNKVLIAHLLSTIGHHTHTDDWHDIPWINLSRCRRSELIINLIHDHIEFSNKKENTETSLQNGRRTKGIRVSTMIINNALFQMR